MCTINKSDLNNMIAKMSVLASEEVKATFTMFAKKVEDKYLNQVRLTGKSEQVEVNFYVAADGDDKKATKFSVESKRFCEVASSLLTFDKDVDIAASDGVVSLSIENTTLTIPTTTSIDPISFNKEGAVAVTMEGKAFNTVLRKGGFAVDKNSSKPQCKAATLEVALDESKTITVSSSDANIIAQATGTAQAVKVADGVESLKAAIPAEALEAVLKLTQGASVVNFMATQTQFAVAAGGTMFVCTLATQSMDVSKFLQMWNALKLEEGVTVDADSILNAVKVLNVADPDNKGFFLKLDGEERFDIVTASGKQNVALFPIESLENFAETDTGISKLYLEKIVKNLNKGNVTIRTNNSGQMPYVITNGTCKEPDTKAVAYVMKMKMTVAKKVEETEEAAESAE